VLALVILALCGGGTGGWWWYHAHHTPTRTCPRCDGEKYVPVKHLRRNAEHYKKCPKCDGQGHLLKWQARRALKRAERRAA